MAQYRGQLRFVVHERQELAGNVNIAARDREGIIHRGIEQGDGEIALGIGEARLDGDPAPDPLHICRLRTLVGTAELFQQLRVRLGTGGLVACRDASDGLGLRGDRN